MINKKIASEIAVGILLIVVVGMVFVGKESNSSNSYKKELVCEVENKKNVSEIKYPEFIAGSNLDNFARFSDVKNWQNYVSSDGIISLRHPVEWKIDDSTWKKVGLIRVINEKISDGNILEIERVKDNAVTVEDRIRQDEEGVVFSEQAVSLGNSLCIAVTTKEKYSIYCPNKGYYISINMGMGGSSLRESLLEYLMSTLEVR